MKQILTEIRSSNKTALCVRARIKTTILHTNRLGLVHLPTCLYKVLEQSSGRNPIEYECVYQLRRCAREYGNNGGSMTPRES